MMMNHNEDRHMFFNRTTCCNVLSIFTILIAIYSLTYSGTFVTDDEHILSARTISFAFDDHINNSRVIGNTRVYALSQLPPEALNIEPGQMILGSVLAHLGNVLHVGIIQTLFMMNIWLSALSAVVLFGILLFMGYSHSTAITLSLFYGLGTIIWPYTRTYFRDPLAMVCLLCAWLFMELISKKDSQTPGKLKSILLWAGVFLFLVAGILSKNTVIIALPIFFIKIFIHLRNQTVTTLHGNKRIWYQLWIPIGILISIVLIWLLGFQSEKLLGRFSVNYYTYLFRFFTSNSHPAMLDAIIGSLFSPGKSIFLYSPLILLSFIGLFSHWKYAWPGWLYLVFLIIGQALFYDSDWAGMVNWGLRFTLPAIPLLVIGAAGIFDACLKSIPGKITLLILAVGSVIVQLAGVLSPVEKYYAEMANVTPAVPNSSLLWNLHFTNLAWSIQWLFSGGVTNIAAGRMPGPSIWIVVGLVILVLLSLINFRITKKWISIVSGCLCIGLTIGILYAYRDDPAWFRSRGDLSSAQSTVARQYQKGDIVLVKSYGSPAWSYWMNWSDPHIPFTSLPYIFPNPTAIAKYQQTNNPADALDPITLDIMDEAVMNGRRIWLVIPSDSPGSDLNLEQDWFSQHSSRSQHWIFKRDSQTTRLNLFSIDPIE
jgi:hypothetical protein